MFSLKAIILSQTKGRIRLACPQFHTAHVDSWTKHLLEVPGVLSASINKKAGTMLVTYDPKKIDYPVFNMVFNHQVDKQIKRDVDAYEHFTYTPPQKEPMTDVQKKRKIQRKLRRFENRNMVVSGITLLAGIATKNWYLHAFGGWWFTAAALAHSWRYRKTIWR
ncbi:MAG: hypothetical protein LUC43_06950 [Burkholderiales bacterium]|nr:hypothetical protein [Burkholderiales bacterium]